MVDPVPGQDHRHAAGQLSAGRARTGERVLPTSSSARTVLPPALTLVVAFCALLGAGLALAGPAAAVEDPRRPSAEVTHGPSCGPAVVRTLVTNGTEAHRVALLLDGVEQDSAVVGPAEQGELGSADVAWGVTVDVSVTVADLDGTAEEPLVLGTYTRPSAEDCAAITAPPTTTPPTTTPVPRPTSRPSPTPPSTQTTTVPPTSPSTRPTTPAPSWPGGSTPAPSSSSPSSTPAGDAEQDPPGDDVSSGSAGSASAASVSPGGVVTVRATGFTPGEAVTVSFAGVEQPLTRVTAAADGSVEAVVQIPRGAPLGTATVQFLGGESAALAGLDLQVAARTRPVAEPTGSPAVVAAGLALVGAAGTLGMAGARRSRGRHSTPSR